MQKDLVDDVEKLKANRAYHTYFNMYLLVPSRVFTLHIVATSLSLLARHSVADPAVSTKF